MGGWGGGLSNYSISSLPWFIKSQVFGIKLGLARVKARAKELDNSILTTFFSFFLIPSVDCLKCEKDFYSVNKEHLHFSILHSGTEHIMRTILSS